MIFDKSQGVVFAKPHGPDQRGIRRYNSGEEKVLRPRRRQQVRAQQEEVAGAMELDKRAIEAILPHRAPFLMIDHVELVDGDRIVASKTVAADEPLLQGHFPGHPHAGVLIIEAMAQAGAVLAARQSSFDPARQIMVFMAIDKAKFRKPVLPVMS